MVLKELFASKITDKEELKALEKVYAVVKEGCKKGNFDNEPLLVAMENTGAWDLDEARKYLEFLDMDTGVFGPRDLGKTLYLSAKLGLLHFAAVEKGNGKYDISAIFGRDGQALVFMKNEPSPAVEPLSEGDLKKYSESLGRYMVEECFPRDICLFADCLGALDVSGMVTTDDLA